MEHHFLNSEQEIIKRIAGDDQRAFAVLIEHYSPVIYSHALRYLKNAFQAEEVTQDIFLQIWKHRKELPGIANFQGYVHVMTRNGTSSAFRKKMLTWEEAKQDELEAAMPDPGKALELRELSESLQKAINLLPPRRKEVFTLSRFNGLSYEEIAEKLGISKSAVNQHIVEALVYLRTHLRNQVLVLGVGCWVLGVEWGFLNPTSNIQHLL